MLVQPGEAAALGRANSSPPLSLRKLMKRREPGSSQLCKVGGQERAGIS